MQVDRWLCLDHAHHWASALFALLVLGLVVTQTLKYESLATRGLPATATVLAYEPQRPSYRGGGKTYHDHLLAFAGHVERVELSRMRVPGSQIPVVYLPDRPGIVVEVEAHAKPGDLLGLATLGRLIVFGLGGLALFVWGARGLFLG
jgi:hypothetical protein